jgi:ABC-type sugar transport system permease subunit
MMNMNFTDWKEYVQNMRTRMSSVNSLSFDKLLLLPSVAYITVIIGVPALFLAYLTLTQDVFSLFLETKFVGLENIISVLTSGDFWLFTGNTLLYTAGVIGIGIPVQLGIAIALNTDLPYRRVWQTLLLIPWTIPFVISTVMWKLMFIPEFGVINHMLLEVGLINQQIQWFSGTGTAYFTAIITTIWIMTPLGTTILLAGLESIPDNLYEASYIDGAGLWNQFRHVTLPLLRPALTAVLVIESMLALRGFEIIYTMTRGGPGRSTTVVAIDIYRQMIRNGNAHYAAAEGLILVVLILIVLGIIVKGLSSDIDLEVE